MSARCIDCRRPSIAQLCTLCVELANALGYTANERVGMLGGVPTLDDSEPGGSGS